MKPEFKKILMFCSTILVISVVIGGVALMFSSCYDKNTTTATKKPSDSITTTTTTTKPTTTTTTTKPDPEPEASSQGLNFALNDDGKSYSVVGIGTCTDTDVVIPSTYEGNPVTSIGSSAFRDCTSLTSITIPDSVMSIEKEAFERCSSLKNVYYQGTLEDWCNIKFSYDSNPCCNGANLYINGELLTNAVIPDTVTSINDYAFRGCTSLTSVTIPDSVTSIGDNAFINCTSLEVVYWNAVACTKAGLKNYTDDSITVAPIFSGCTSLKTVVINDNVTTIPPAAFTDCTSLTSVTIPDRATLPSLHPQNNYCTL